MERDLLNREINSVLSSMDSMPLRSFETGQTSSNLVVLHRVESTSPFTNKRFSSHKIYDKANRKFIYEWFDERGNQINAPGSQIIGTPASINDKIHPTLKSQISKTSDLFPIPIAVWLNLPMNEPLKTKFKPEELRVIPKEIAEYRTSQSAKIKKAARNATIERPGIQVERVSDLLPLFFAKATKSGIARLAADSLVLAIFFHDKTYTETLATSLGKSGAAEAQKDKLTSLGKDIKVAVWENAPDVLTNLTIEAYFDPSTPVTSQHSRLVSAIIKNKEAGKPKGYAPNCKLYSANISSADFYAPLEWAVKQGCTVINQSFHTAADQINAGMQLTDFITDALATLYPYPTIVQASGNTGQPDDTALGISPAANEYVNHKGYNSITVGSHDEQKNPAISAFSTFRNPSSTHSDRELPEICALGENISAAGVINWNGTSFASPAVAGSVALLQSVHFILKYCPEVCRALLLAGSKRNVDSGTWYEDLKKVPKVDQKDGTGALNIYESIKIAKRPYSPRNTAADKGWDRGRLDAGSLGAWNTVKTAWKIKVPYNRKHVKIALAWNSTADYSKIWAFRFLGSSTLDMDLDILVYDDKNNLVASSSSYDNSYEIAEYIAKGGETLTVKIRIPTIKTNAWTYFGIAWTTF